MKRLLVFTLVVAVACSTTPPPPPSTVAPPTAAAPPVMPGTGAIHGVITDWNGATLPGVIVTARDANGGTRSVITDVNGWYAINGIAPGRYTLIAEVPGLGARTGTATVTASAVTKVPLAISYVVSQTITVTAEAPVMATSGVTAMNVGTQQLGGNARTVRQTAPVPAPAPVPPPMRVADVQARPQYAYFEDHGFLDTSKEQVTTFAIDVDRASYANIRRFLSSGLVPPRDAVRIEEMVNYFTYSYPQPAGEHPFSITTEVSGCPWNPQNRLLRIGIQGRNLEQWKMAPNNLVFLVDVSGSMSTPERLPLVKQAFRVLVDQLRAEDRVAIVTYAGYQALALPSTSGADKAAILTAIGKLGAGGSTAGAAGIELAYKVARENFLKNGNNRVILATDGDFNVGVSSVAELQKLIEKERESGVFLSTIGVGTNNYQDAVMETLADKGNGNYAYLDSLKEAEKVFKRELTGTLVTIAKDVKVQLDFDPSTVASYRQIGYENRALANADFTDDTKDAGELGGFDLAGVVGAAMGQTAEHPPAVLGVQINAVLTGYSAHD